MSAVAVKPQTKSIDESRAEIFALFDAGSRGGLVWESLEPGERRVFCFAAGLKQSHIDKPLSSFDELDRFKLFRAIKSVEQAAAKLAGISLPEFK